MLVKALISRRGADLAAVVSGSENTCAQTASCHEKASFCLFLGQLISFLWLDFLFSFHFFYFFLLVGDFAELSRILPGPLPGPGGSLAYRQSCLVREAPLSVHSPSRPWARSWRSFWRRPRPQPRPASPVGRFLPRRRFDFVVLV